MSFFIFHWLYFILIFIPPAALLLVKPKSKAILLLNSILVVLMGVLWFFLFDWPLYFSYYLRYLYIFFVFTICFLRIKKIKKLPLWNYYNLLKLCFTAIKVLFLIFCFSRLILVIEGSKIDEQFIDIKFPFKQGNYYIIQGGSNTMVNYHHDLDSGQAYALDIIKINKMGSPFKKFFFSLNLEENEIFKDTVYSPSTGIVVDIWNKYEDHGYGTREMVYAARGNCIIIRLDSNHFVELFHLLKGSASVNIGDSVKTGQAVALVGNSGKSSGPHLHINAFLREKGKETSIPMLFNGKYYIRNSIISR